VSLAFNIILHGLLAGSLALFIFLLIALAAREPDPRERVLRVAALAVGALIALGSRAFGTDYATFIAQAMAGTRPASAAAHVAATLVPALLGVGIGFFLTRVFGKSQRLGMRVFTLVGMLTAIAFLQMYAEAVKVDGVFMGKAQLPNIVFVVGVLLTIILTDDPDRKPGDPGLWRQLGKVLANRSSASSSQGVMSKSDAFRDPFED
jgi:F0F1-type ATP synthase assembly protein I